MWRIFPESLTPDYWAVESRRPTSWTTSPASFVVALLRAWRLTCAWIYHDKCWGCLLFCRKKVLPNRVPLDYILFRQGFADPMSTYILPFWLSMSESAKGKLPPTFPFPMALNVKRFWSCLSRCFFKSVTFFIYFLLVFGSWVAHVSPLSSKRRPSWQPLGCKPWEMTLHLRGSCRTTTTAASKFRRNWVWWMRPRVSKGSMVQMAPMLAKVSSPWWVWVLRLKMRFVN